MIQPNVAPYGAWKSPITSDLIASGTIRLGQVALDGDDVYWVEVRPSEAGRSVVVRLSADGRVSDVTPPPFNVRTRVHEYGGGAFWVADGAVYFSNFDDQRLYRQDPGDAPHAITPEGGLRYADALLDTARARLICVCEDHTNADEEPVNSLVSLDPAGAGAPKVLVSGNDFYSSPRLSPDGRRLAWLTWNHPNMPWQGTELRVGEMGEDGSVRREELVAGGSEESVFQPEWSPDGVLHFVSDRTGWWNLYRAGVDGVEPLCEREAEFGVPQWGFAMSTYAFVAAGRIVCAYCENGMWRLARIDTAAGKLELIETPYSDISQVRAASGRVVFRAGSPTEPSSIVRLELATGQCEVLRRSSDAGIDAGYLSTPEAIEFPTGGGLTAHAFFYPGRNCDYTAPAGDKPPLLVMSHGGPTAATSAALDLRVQYWTSRGFAVLDVNYGGSTGYGRAYRQRLHGAWGVVDVADCVNGARFLVERGTVDGERLIIRGGSAGGYVALCALTFYSVFKAGASYYGIGDLESLVADTHKFESRYLDWLVGPYPERRDLYRQRSPVHFTDRLSCPVIFFHGLDDRVVPPNQADAMVEVLRAKGLPVAHITFEGEQHGFRRAESIKRCLDAELYFYSRVFGFEPADPLESAPIENV